MTVIGHKIESEILTAIYCSGNIGGYCSAAVDYGCQHVCIDSEGRSKGMGFPYIFKSIGNSRFNLVTINNKCFNGIALIWKNFDGQRFATGNKSIACRNHLSARNGSDGNRIHPLREIGSNHLISYFFRADKLIRGYGANVDSIHNHRINLIAIVRNNGEGLAVATWNCHNTGGDNLTAHFCRCRHCIKIAGEIGCNFLILYNIFKYKRRDRTHIRSINNHRINGVASIRSDTIAETIPTQNVGHALRNNGASVHRSSCYGANFAGEVGIN